MIFQVGVTDSLVIRNKDVKGLNFNNFLTGATADTAITVPSVDYAKIHCRVELMQDGAKTTIYNGKLEPLLNAALLNTAAYAMVSPVSANKANIKRLVDASGVKELSNNGAIWYFGDIINLRGGDTLTVELALDSDVYHATADSALSYLNVEAVEGIGKQVSIPVWETVALNNTEENPKYTLGDNITRIIFVNLNKTDILDASKVIDRVTLESDRVNFKKNYEDLIVERHCKFPTIASADDRMQSFVLHSIDEGATEIDSVKLDLDVIIANISASQNFLVISRFVTNKAIAQRYDVRNQKHISLAQIKFAQPVSGAKS